VRAPLHSWQNAQTNKGERGYAMAKAGAALSYRTFTLWLLMPYIICTLSLL